MLGYFNVILQTAKLVLDEHFLSDSDHFTSGIEYFNYEDELDFPVTSTHNIPRTSLSPGNALCRELSLDSTAISESEETYKPRRISEESCSTQQGILSEYKKKLKKLIIYPNNS